MPNFLANHARARVLAARQVDAAAQSTEEDAADSPAGARHYLGPTLLLQSGEAWWSTGAYLRLDHLAEAAVAEDPYGKAWIRTMLGMGF